MVSLTNIVILINEIRVVNVDIDLSTNLYTDLGFSSIQFVRFISMVENKYEIAFDIMEIQECIQIERLINLINHKIEEKTRCLGSC